MGKTAARISTDFKQENKKADKWLKDKDFLNDNVSVEKADVCETIDLKKTIGASIAAKSIVKKYRNLARKNLTERGQLEFLLKTIIMMLKISYI